MTIRKSILIGSTALTALCVPSTALAQIAPADASVDAPAQADFNKQLTRVGLVADPRTAGVTVKFSFGER